MEKIINTNEVDLVAQDNSLYNIESKTGPLSSLRNKIFKEDKWLSFGLLIGLFSGFLTSSRYNFITDHAQSLRWGELDNFKMLTVGFLFGVFSLFYFIIFSFKELKIKESLFWIGFSSLSFWLAYNFCTFFYSDYGHQKLYILPFSIAGIIGISILIFIFSTYFCILNLRNILLILSISTFFSVFWIVLSNFLEFVSGYGFLFFVNRSDILFITWQTAVLVTFGYFIHKQNLRITAGE